MFYIIFFLQLIQIEQGFELLLFRIIEVTINSNEKAKIALKLMMCVGGHHSVL